MIDPAYRTKINKCDGRWRVSYWIPYGGFLYADFPTWEKAMDDACQVELQKAWT